MKPKGLIQKPINSILFVCLGNICRSPTAEAVFRYHAKRMGLALEMDSAGTAGYHIGERPDPRSEVAARQRGYDFQGMRARQVQPQDLQRFDLILAADRQNLAELQRMASPAQQPKLGLILQWGDGEVEEVPDPYYGGEEGFEQVLNLLEASAKALLSRIASTY
ncbi:low molecular weight protein-tyrosine-phosphatase [Ferrimonas gelatinilytica]|uniref:protein-tyrosine-phosphatase n=1 Tax=Ferrimonas gelatinilytica TaxID=1255257 RepID=A0ABP9S0B2_9GAMM